MSLPTKLVHSKAHFVSIHKKTVQLPLHLQVAHSALPQLLSAPRYVEKQTLCSALHHAFLLLLKGCSKTYLTHIILPLPLCLRSIFLLHVSGETVVVARGGKGGMGVNRPAPEDKARQRSRQRRFLVSHISNTTYTLTTSSA